MRRQEFDMSRHQAQRKHAQQRLRARFGIDLRDAEFKQIVDEFLFHPETNRFKFVGRQNNRISFFEFTIQDRTVIGVYSRKTKQFCTFLTPEMFKKTALKTPQQIEPDLWPVTGTLAGLDTGT